MSSYEHRITRAGESHRIRFRHDGRNQAKTFLTAEQAFAWQALLDVIGPAKAVAALELDDEPDGPAGPTVAEHVAHHIEHLTGVSDGTRKRYRDNMRRRLDTDPLGHTPLAKAGRGDYAAWVKRLELAGMAAKTIKNHHSVVSDALRSAVRDGLLAYNHAEGVRIATPDEDDHDEMVTLTLREVWQFIAVAPHHWRPMVTFMFGTGVRWQEAAALKVRDVDLDQMQARVVRAWKDTAGQGHQLGKPKSRRSRRTIVFGMFVANSIRPLVEGRSRDAFLFTNTLGGPVRYQNFYDQAWAKTLHAFAGDTATKIQAPRGRPKILWEPGPGKRPTPHDARHTYASLQIARGKSLAFIQRQLGHESITTTNETYGHLQTEDLRALADVIDDNGDHGALQLEGPGAPIA